MLTAIGRAAAQRLVLRAAPLVAVPRSQPVVVRAAARRGFSATQWARLAARASTTKATKATPKAKKAAAPTDKKAKKGRPAKKKAAKPKKPVATKPGRPKKVLTPEEKLKADMRAWKKGAMLNEPKTLPATAWVVHTQQELAGKSLGKAMIGDLMREAAYTFKNLPSFELQRLQEKAKENTLANNAAYKAWVESHPPSEVYEANSFRRRIRKATGKKTPAPIHDERLPKRPQTAYSMFFQARFASGDVAGVRNVEAAAIIGEQWRNMPPSEKSAYEDVARAAQDRYARELNTILGRTVRD